MARASSIEIFSIFGQIERVAAQIMIDNGEAKRIDLKDFPAGAPVINDAGQSASFGVLMKRNKIRKFNELIADLRA